jgi:hypothetical protein
MICQQLRFSRTNILRARLPFRRIRKSLFSSSAQLHGYDDTIQNLKIGAHTRVNAKESMEWGTNVVGGVKPNGSGEHLGKPVLPSVRAAMEQLKPDATGIYVAAHQATAAIEEAIEAEVPLIVAVAEHIPLHDIMRVSKDLKGKLVECVLIHARYTLCCRVSPSRGSLAQMPPVSYQQLVDAALDFNPCPRLALATLVSLQNLALYRTKLWGH